MHITGVVKRINRDRGFGFLVPDAPGPSQDVFFHRSACGGHWHGLVEGVSRVSCTVETTEKGLRAADVRAVA